MTFIHILDESTKPIFKDPKACRKIILGAVLSLIPVLSFISLGYLLSVFKNQLESRQPENLPVWKNIDEYFYQGVIFFLVLMTYSTLPILFTSASFSMLHMGFVFFLPAVATLLIGAALWLAAVFFVPMAMALIIQKKSIAAVSNLGEIYRRISLVLNLYVPATVMIMIVLAIVFMPVLVSIKWYVLCFPVAFLVMLFLASVCGRICAEVYPGP